MINEKMKIIEAFNVHLTRFTHWMLVIILHIHKYTLAHNHTRTEQSVERQYSHKHMVNHQKKRIQTFVIWGLYILFRFVSSSSSSFLLARLITKTFHLQQQRRRQRQILFFFSLFLSHTLIRSLSPEFPLAWKCIIHNNNNNRNKNYKLRTSANNHSQSAHAFFLNLNFIFFYLIELFTYFMHRADFIFIFIVIALDWFVCLRETKTILYSTRIKM